MKKQNLLLFILLAFAVLFPMTAFAAEDMKNGIGMKDGFVLIQGGTFQMGSPVGEPERSSGETQHSVTVGDLWDGTKDISDNS